jgi:hypothetical protein
MSLQSLQTAFGLLVSGEDAAGAGHAAGLTGVEQGQLDHVAAQSGLATVRMLYQSWRLTKVLTLLPLTVGALGDDAPELLTEFWRQRPARGPYFVEECLAFLDYLDGRAAELGVPGLTDLAAFERARLGLHAEISAGRQRATVRVRFDHDPAAVFRAAHATGARVDLVPAPTTLQGELSADGSERWSVVE